MVGKSKHRTKDDQRRFDSLKAMGCIICRERGLGWVYPEIHHLISGYRKGHQETIPLCQWHHQGKPLDIEVRPSQMKMIAGPSLALHKREFIEQHGTEKEILDRVNAELDRMGALNA